MTHEQIKTLANLLDGHTIYDPRVLERQANLPGHSLDEYLRTYKSNIRDPKETITNNEGHILKELKGICGLDLLYTMAAQLKIHYVSMLGRGSQAREIMKSINEKY